MTDYSILDEQSRVNAQVRHANHTALADSLMDFKQNRDLEQLFAKYGTPLIKRTGSCDPKESNVDIYRQQNIIEKEGKEIMNYIIYTPSGARVKEVMEERVTGKGRGIRMVKIQ